MSQSNSTTITQAGKITVTEGMKGLQLYAFNHERKKQLHIGTLAGVVYEKTAPILNKPEPSFCLPQSELAAIEEAGGQFIRFIARGTVGTYAISVQDFRLHGEKYFNAGYGPQIRVPLAKFAFTSKVSKRNPIIDNPVIETVQPIGPKQFSLFGGMK
jgi:hypothetical protein